MSLVVGGARPDGWFESGVPTEYLIELRGPIADEWVTFCCASSADADGVSTTGVTMEIARMGTTLNMTTNRRAHCLAGTDCFLE